MTSIRHVLFDLDGTLLDSLSGIEWSADQALQACGLDPLPETLRPLLGPPIRAILARATGITDESRLDSLESAFRASYDAKGWRRTTCYPGTRTMLRDLAACRQLRVVTNKLLFSTHKILHALAIRSFFKEIVCRDSSTPPFASKAEMLINLLERRSLCAAECLMVGDTLEDVRAAEAAGVRCVLVSHGYGTGIPESLLLRNWRDLLDLCIQPAPARAAAKLVRVQR